jgi:hypothetical protein
MGIIGGVLGNVPTAVSLKKKNQPPGAQNNLENKEGSRAALQGKKRRSPWGRAPKGVAGESYRCYFDTAGF